MHAFNDASQPSPTLRTLKFPAARFIDDPSYAWCRVSLRGSAEGIYSGPAQGDVEVPTDARVHLTLEDPPLLGWLRLLDPCVVDSVYFEGPADSLLLPQDLSECIDATGRELAHIAHLTGLRELHLKGDTIKLDLLHWISALRGLHKLELSGTGSAEDLAPHLASLVKLRKLCIRRGSLTDTALEILTGLSYLEEVEINYVPTTSAAVSTLSRLPALRKLSISVDRNDEDGLDLFALHRSERLDSLDIHGDYVDDCLIQDGASVFGDRLLPAIRAIPNLRSLSIRPGVSAWGMRQIARMSTLRELDLGWNKTAEGFAPLVDSQIERLDLERTNVGDRDLESLARMPWLTSLDLRDTRVTAEGLKHLAASSTLETLHVCNLPQEGWAAVSSILALKQVHVGGDNEGAERLRELRPELIVRRW